MTFFVPNRTYDPTLDIRFADGRVPSWAARLVDAPRPHAHCWLVVLPRRGGKTWLAEAIRHARGLGKPTEIYDLRGSAVQARQAGVYDVLIGQNRPVSSKGLLIIDEPGETLGPQFTEGLTALRDSGLHAVVLLTPGEYARLEPHLDADAYKDLVLPSELGPDEVRRMASRTDWASEVVDRLEASHPEWLKSAFLLELVLSVAEEHPGMRGDAEQLVQEARETAERGQYLQQVLWNGLTPAQRGELRASRWRAAGVLPPTSASASVVADTTIPGDPVLSRHMPEVLRIHHISDLHFGGHLRELVDTKDQTKVGEILAELAGAGTPLDRYLNHISKLAASGQAPHLVIVTGDLVNSPGEIAGDAAVAWLKELGSRLADHADLRPDDRRIVLVGGNHDVSWDLCLDPDKQARHAWFAKKFAGFPHPELHLPVRADRQLEVSYPGAGLQLLLLGSAESGGEPQSDEDRDLIKDLQSRLSSAGDEQAIREIVLELEHLDPGVIARDILDRVSVASGSLSFALLHHPVSPVPAVEVSPYSGVVNAGQAKRILARARTALILHGHTHMAFFAAERLLDAAPEWTMRIAGAPTLAAASSDEQNGYNEVYVAREGGEHSVLVRPMRLDGGIWTPQQVFGFRPGASAECTLADLLQDVPVAAG